MRSSVSASDTRPRPCVAMKVIASALAFSAATKRSPSFSRSALSTRMTMRPLRTSGRTCSTRYSLVRGALMRGRVSRVRRVPRDEAHELGACFLAVELAGESGGGRDRMLLLDAAHDHAHVLRFDDHGYAEGFQRLFDAVAHVDR